MKQFQLPDRTAAVRLMRNLASRVPEVGPQAVDRPLVFYGAGNLGRLAAQLLDTLGIPVAYAVDRAPPENGLLLGKIPVILPDKAPKADRETHLLAVCVVLAPYQPIHESLVDQGWRHVFPFYDIAEAYTEKLPMGNGWFTGKLDEIDQRSLEKTLVAWGDDISRATHLQFLAWRMHRQEFTFVGTPINTKDRYFPDFICKLLREDETFLDAGAYLGEICLRFDSITGGQYSSLIAIEADPENYAQLHSRLANLRSITSKNILILNFALGCNDESANYCSELGIGARLFSAGSTSVRCCRLDDLDINYSFAKLHLEGGELDAIAGALKSLKRNRPILAITVYHSVDGLFRIPLLLMDELTNYQFFLRAHAWSGTGLVLYGIPEERLPGKTNKFHRNHS